MGRRIKKSPVCGMALALVLMVLTAILVNANHSGKFIPAGSMNIPRDCHQAVLLTDGRVLICGGGFNNPSAELYDPTTDSWSITGSMLMARDDHTATLLKDGRVLVAGGVNVNTCTWDLTTELYDPSSGTWSFTGNLPLARTGHTATLLEDGRVLLAGGGNRCGGVYSSAALYDPMTGSWTATGSMTQAREFHSAVRLTDGRVLVAGGMGPGYPYGSMDSAEIYDPESGTWSLTGNMTIQRSGGGNGSTVFSFLALLNDGRVLAATSIYGPDGWNMKYRSKIAEIFDPSTGVWTTTGSMITARSNLSLVRLNDGTVMAAGGRGGEGPDWEPLSQAEIYDPVTGTWSLTESMNAQRYSHSTTVLTNGNVLIAGGCIGDKPGTLTATAEIYVELTPQEAIEDLILLTEDMNLQNGINNSLDAKLDAVLKALEDTNENNDVAAINALNAFINAVEAQRGNKISEADADILIAAALDIIAMLNE